MNDLIVILVEKKLQAYPGMSFLEALDKVREELQEI